MRRLLAAAAVVLVALGLLAAPAAAHAQLVSTTPSSGAVLDTAPTEATVRFDEGVRADAGALQLHDGGGRRVDIGELRRRDGGKTIAVPLGDLPDGGYVLTWRVESDDGHPVSGGVTWRVGASSTAVDQGVFQQLLNEEGGDSAVRAVAAAVRTILFASLLLLVGGLLFVLAVWPAGADDDRLRPTLRAAAAVGALATVLGMGLQGADVAGRGLGHAFGLGAVADTLDTSYGQAAVARLVLLAVLAWLAAVATPAVVRSRRWQFATLAAAATTLLTLTLAGHARTGRWVGLATPLDLVHLGAAATWLGGLAILTLVVLPRDADGNATPIAARFSRIAALAVGAVVVTGVVQGIRQLGAVDGLRDTNYGRLLVIKVVIVAVVAVLGAMSRSLVRAQVDALVPVGPSGEVLAGGEGEAGEEPDPAEVRRSLRRSVGAETLIAVAVLAVTSLLVAANPARTLESKGFSAAKVVQGTVIEAAGGPARTGPVDIHVYVSDPTLGLTTPLEATATLSLPAKGIRAVQVPLRPAGRGHWSAYDVDVPIRGTWQLAVRITVGRFDERRATFPLTID